MNTHEFINPEFMNTHVEKAKGDFQVENVGISV